ncbi:MAG: hypothetical protein ACRBEE_04745 [Arenicella sp.]
MYQAKKRLIAVLALLAFLMNVVLPFYAVSSITAALNKSDGVAQKGTEQNSLAALLGDKILICTSTGYKWISLSEFYGEDTDNDAPHQSLECPLCYISKDENQDLMAAHFSHQVEPHPAQLARVSIYGSVYRHHNKHLLLSGGFTRAPPIIFT